MLKILLKNKEKLRKKLRKSYLNLPEKEKDKKGQYYQESNKNLSEDKKKKKQTKKNPPKNKADRLYKKLLFRT